MYFIHIFIILCFLAERRAQLSRSRSRQNLFQATSATDVVREINFDDSTPLPGSAEKEKKPRGRNRGGGSKGQGGVGSMTEAEELLKRLQEL